jgi:serine/threonine protein kinase
LSSPNAQRAVFLRMPSHFGKRRGSARTGVIMRALMSLSPGTKLGPYEIQAPLGAGGMGEVYRARDTRLDRIVAIKVLPSRLSSDPDLKQRLDV